MLSRYGLGSDLENWKSVMSNVTGITSASFYFKSTMKLSKLYDIYMEHVRTNNSLAHLQASIFSESPSHFSESMGFRRNNILAKYWVFVSQSQASFCHGPQTHWSKYDKDKYRKINIYIYIYNMIMYWRIIFSMCIYGKSLWVSYYMSNYFHHSYPCLYHYCSPWRHCRQQYLVYTVLF